MEKRLTMWIQDLNVAICITSKAHHEAPKSSGHVFFLQERVAITMNKTKRNKLLDAQRILHKIT